MRGRYVIALLQISTVPLVFAGLGVLGGNETLSGWTLLNLLLWPPMTLASIAFHEAGHAVAALLVGLQVGRIELGIGRRLGRWTRGGVKLVLSTLPFGGRTFVGGKNLTRPRLAAVVIAGPLASAALAALAFAASRPGGFSVNRDFAIIELAAPFNGWLTLLNLLPWSAGLYRSDGLLLLKLPFEPESTFRDSGAIPSLIEFTDAVAEGDLERASTAIGEAKAIAPAARSVRYSEATLDLLLAKFDEARAELVSLLADPESLPAERLPTVSNIAWANFSLRRPELIEEADRYSHEALSGARNEPAFLSTRGAVLFWKGDHHAAVELLDRAWFLNSSPAMRGYNSALLALTWAAIGDGHRANEWLTKSEHLPASPLLAEARQAVASMKQSSG